MPPNGYSTGTICEETAGKLAVVMDECDKDSLSEAIEYAIDTVFAEEDFLDETELARLLYYRLQSKRQT